MRIHNDAASFAFLPNALPAIPGLPLVVTSPTPELPKVSLVLLEHKEQSDIRPFYAPQS